MSRALLALLLLCAQETRPNELHRPELHQLELAAETALELEAFWEPCKDSLYHLFEQTPALREPRPSEPRRRYEAAAFRPFLPREPVALGVPWSVEGEAVLAFLTQFHPGARSHAEFGGEVPGTWALLRAVGPEAFEILLRAHAVLQLEDGVVYKPAQFEGRLVLGRDGKLRSFTLALPSRDTNVDVNVPQAVNPDDVNPDELWVDENGVPVTSTFSADIGWVPRMELTSGAAAAPAWTHAVPDEDARLALRRAFYPFAALDWLPFDEAVLAARERKKPLHLVLLFGCLDDDSC